MVTDEQVRILMKQLGQGKMMMTAAAKAGMDEKTARKWRDIDKLPGQCRVLHTWRTRQDPFDEVWDEVRRYLEVNQGLEAKTIFNDVVRRYPGKFADGQLRTLQRRIKTWRALEGDAKEVFFAQEHFPGRLGQSDFTHMSSLGVTILGLPFNHLIYHFVLTYSNWETGNICFSESFESLSEGLQKALWALGGVPDEHRTDRLSTAVNKIGSEKEFTDRYEALLKHYGTVGKKIQVAEPNENGDVEQSHHRFKRALDQSLMLRNSRDFSSVVQYEAFLGKLFSQLNAGRWQRFEEELKHLLPLPKSRLESYKRIDTKVGQGSTIRVQGNTYSLNSRLIKEKVRVHVFADRIEVFYAQRLIESFPRLRGKGGHKIDYRHIIDWLVRKPGAFANYKYKSDLFPTSRFRMAYDALKTTAGSKADSQYLKILYLAAKETQVGVDRALDILIKENLPISDSAAEQIMSLDVSLSPTDVVVAPVNLSHYDNLLVAGAV